MSSLTSLSIPEQVDGLSPADKEVVCQQLDTFTRRLIGLARKHLKSKSGAFIDPEDVVQSVFKSIISRLHKDPYWLVIENPDGLFALLATITVRKCWRKLKRSESQPTMRLSGLEIDLCGIGSGEIAAVDEAIVKETIDYVLGDMDEEDLEVAQRLILEQPVSRIADELNCTHFYVKSIRTRMRERLVRLSQINLRAEGD